MAQSHGKPKNYNITYTPNAINRMPQDLVKGQEVYGEYFGHLFSGTIIYREVTSAYNTNYYVQLKLPIYTNLGPTEQIVFSSNIKDEHSNQLPNHWIKGV